MTKITKVELMALRHGAEKTVRVAKERFVLDMVELGHSYKDIGKMLGGISASRVYQIKRIGEIRLKQCGK